MFSNSGNDHYSPIVIHEDLPGAGTVPGGEPPDFM